MVQDLVRTNSLLLGVGRVEYLDKGFSDDAKFVLWQNGEPCYVLRIIKTTSVDRRRAEFGYLERYFANGVKCARPVQFGVIQEKRMVLLACKLHQALEKNLTRTQGTAPEGSAKGAAPWAKFLRPSRPEFQESSTGRAASPAWHRNPRTP